MKWLTIPYIKTHSRIDYDCEDSLLELYGNAAEETILNIINRSFDELVEKFGSTDAAGNKLVPAAIIQASLMIVDNSYQFRAPATTQNVYTTLYGVDALIKPYMKLG